MGQSQKSILCMFSGGLDSVGVLYQLLTAEEYKDYAIHVHHMHLLNREDRSGAEAIAVERIIPLMQQHTGKTVRYTENVMEYRFLKQQYIWDMDLAAFMAANIVRDNREICMVAMGRTKTDVSNASDQFFARMERAQKLYELSLSLEDGLTIPERIFPVVDLTKAEIYAMLPAEIRECAWSCRSPIYFDHQPPQPCGVCPTCEDMRQIVAGGTSV